MKLFERRTLTCLLIAGVLCAALFFPAMYFVGLALAPDPPVAVGAAPPPLIADALWARADGGRATEFTPITPLSMARFAVCVAVEDFKDTTPGDARRVAACQHHQPGLPALEYFSRMHMRDSNLPSSFGEGLARMSTTVSISHSWTKAEFLNTLAERGEVGSLFRGVNGAARGYFGRDVAALSLPQAAAIAGLMGNRQLDPWCERDAAETARNRILERMYDNGAISGADLQSALAAPLELAAPPEGRPPCRK